MKKQLPSTQVFSYAEIEIHYKRPLFSKMKSISSAEDVNALLRAYIHPNQMDVKEFFFTIFLSRANTVLGIATIGVGTIDGVNVNIREIFELTLLTHASHIIVAHNHPSGKLQPSQNDRKITEKLRKGLSLFDVKLLDHLILTSEDYLSFANEGEL
ncbi:JAB domain-containing protein [Polaribacter cellanae]|uniref:JAB domain-containing protein n=1 Tax=Polaribacter cellanae TaxID=2818493 RepID=A0A975H572_9FLAO|nr:JAB domain-containing protein [Polaribacter cellanae]QTE21106.1 JAB domain-containing protein [Polaribacter cellanae]